MEPPWPPKAIEFLDVLAMDGTPQGYMEASLFAREAGEFGAMWHGVWWEDHTVLDATPNVAGPDWVWAAPVPTDWRPSVTMGAGEVQVSFLTYCDLGQVHLTRFVDRYVPEQGCHFTAESTRLAGGPGGKIY